MDSSRLVFGLSSFLLFGVPVVAGCGSSTTSEGSGLTRGAGDPSGDAGDEATTARGSVEAGARTVSYTRDIQPVWDRHCTECHAERAPVLTKAKSFDALTKGKSQARCAASGQIPYVVAGAPAESFLFYKLTGEASFSVSGEACKRLMPADRNGGGTPLAQIDGKAIQLVSTWISEGANAD
jgi:hypothetical protein